MKYSVLLLALGICFAGFSQGNKPLEPEMVLVEGGEFVMGSNDSLANEMPAHKVSLHSFYIGKYEVTQELWQSVMGSNPSGFKGCTQCPVENVNKKSIAQFLEKLNKLTGKNYRLPTEAEWEYAAMGGKKSKGYAYSGSNDPAEAGWYKPNSGKRTHPVGQKKANELGIYDMMGNVWEQCSDRYDRNYYKKSPPANPENKAHGFYSVLRGGSWRSMEVRCYNKARNRNIRDHHISNGGMRLVLDKL